MRRIPLTLSLYIGRQFLFAILSTLGIMLLIVGLMELLELIRRTADVPGGVPFAVLMEMTLLKLPSTFEKVYPFAFLIGGMVTLSRLTRSHELAVVRAAGISVWQFLAPGLVLAVVMGVLAVGMINPMAAAMISRFDKIEARYISGKPSVLSISPSGLWLKEISTSPAQLNGVPIGEYILHARHMDQSNLSLDDVILFFFGTDHRFIGRVDAARAELTRGSWQISEAVISTPGKLPEPAAAFTLPTSLTLTQIEESFSPPETFSFWELPHFIHVLEKAGFSAIRHKLYWHSLMALPLLLAGMLMLAAVFSLRQARRGKTGAFLVLGVLAGFIYYFATNLVYALGSSGALPIALAGWAPSFIVVMLGVSLLLHLEDG
jgi:lipopolysaccharide export system permease protein